MSTSSMTHLCLLLAIGTSAFAQDKPESKPPEEVREPTLRRELLDREEEDQSARAALMKWMRGKPSADQAIKDPKLVKEVEALQNQVKETDEENTKWLKVIVVKHGWPGRSLVGSDGAKAGWILIQHADADPVFQRKCLRLMQGMDRSEVPRQQVAYLIDRILIAEKKDQRYGTQLTSTPEGAWKPLPIEDERNVDKRRAEMDLEPLKKYVTRVNDEVSGKKKSTPITKPQ